MSLMTMGGAVVTDLPDLVAFVRACLDEDERDWQMVAALDVVQMLHGRPLAPRMLGDVAAKRAILDEHGPKTTRYVDAPDEESCRRCGKYDEYPVPYPCHTVHLLAQPFAGRPGWREEWTTGGAA